MSFTEIMSDMTHPIVLLSWLFLLSPSQCRAAGPVVLQPRQLLTLPGNTTTSSPVTLQCSLGPGFSMPSYTMMWYRQVREVTRALHHDVVPTG
ncbi:unnamed protein product [Oncorhynchus mykiss]|uniref:Ig-like domain-containing protein n=1 Tax=Oncorhynchus mykiss TaxID=8022 RepID=A0A060Z8M8_ONCMY|nr:unnamed protein product [Oncorhynchus mykiss]